MHTQYATFAVVDIQSDTIIKTHGELYFKYKYISNTQHSLFRKHELKNQISIVESDTSFLSCSSAARAIERFDSLKAAEKYKDALNGTSVHQREVRCIRRGFAGLAPGSHVLDLPCGTGRLLPVLASLGFKVTAADASAYMVREARHYAHREALEISQRSFLVSEVSATGFANNSFDAVVCNRLFHHFYDSADRCSALIELRRICRGPILVSFFCNLAIDAITARIHRLLCRQQTLDRIPIGYRQFSREISRCGLRINRVLPVRPGISCQWYMVLEKE